MYDAGDEIVVTEIPVTADHGDQAVNTLVLEPPTNPGSGPLDLENGIAVIQYPDAVLPPRVRVVEEDSSGDDPDTRN